MRVRFARWLAAGFTAAGLALTIFAVVLLIGGNTEAGFSALLPGVVLTLIGGLYFGPVPYVVVTDSSVAVPVTAGGQGRMTIGPGDRVRMDGNRIVVVGRGSTRRVPAYRSLAHREDWDRMAAEMRQRRH
jgi:hypothetical protein